MFRLLIESFIKDKLQETNLYIYQSPNYDKSVSTGKPKIYLIQTLE